MAKTLVMTFLDESGKKSSINLSNIKDTLSEAQVSTVMDTIISKNIFTASGGDFKVKDSAQIVDKTTEKLTVK